MLCRDGVQQHHSVSNAAFAAAVVFDDTGDTLSQSPPSHPYYSGYEDLAIVAPTAGEDHGSESTNSQLAATGRGISRVNRKGSDYHGFLTEPSAAASTVSVDNPMYSVTGQPSATGNPQVYSVPLEGVDGGVSEDYLDVGGS